jgi:hypothetical protein
LAECYAFFKSSELGLPQPITRRRGCPTPPVLGGGAHSLAREGLGESQSDEGTYTVVLFIYTYFVGWGFPFSYLLRKTIASSHQAAEVQ